MTIINTTGGPRPAPREPRHGEQHVVNTSAVVEEDLVYTDAEPEIVHVLSADGWQARVGGDAIPLVAFVVLDDAKMYGVAVGEDGFIDLRNGVEDRPRFAGYEQEANDDDSKE